ncbi:hypothetical protein BUE80_DR011302 [Diplocarpon rosae]|nr:hypothetical protein BUE80_DR011302 [Diplocarpon rosae]
MPFDRILDYCLMHHFVSMSSLTGPSRLGLIADQTSFERIIFVSWIVRLSLTTELLIDALSFLTRIKKLSQASHTYITRAIRTRSMGLSKGSGTELADSLCNILPHHYRAHLSLNEVTVLQLRQVKPSQGIRAFATASPNLFVTASSGLCWGMNR